MHTRRVRLLSITALLVCVVVGSLRASAQSTQPAAAASAQPRAKVRVLLMGDSTVRGTFPRRVRPGADPLERIVEKLLAAEGDLPPVEVMNYGVDGDSVRGLLESGRYDRDIAKLEPKPDFVFTRYGINDSGPSDWPQTLPKAYHDLVTRLRRDFPDAVITVETIIPYSSRGNEAGIVRINDAVRQIAADEKLPLLDQHEPFAKEMERQGHDALVNRYVLTEWIPEKLRSLVPPECFISDGKIVCVMDNSLDVHFRDVPGWFSDRHPNLAGYHVIGKELARCLAPQLRERTKSARNKESPSAGAVAEGAK